MELRQYWRVLVRRRNVIRNTVLLVAVLALASVAYSYYGSRWQGVAKIGLQVQPNPFRGITVDPSQAADANTGSVENDLATHGADTSYFKAIVNELKVKYHISKDWRAIGNSLELQPTTTGHGIYVAWKDSTESVATAVAAAAADQMMAYIPFYHRVLQPHLPPILATLIDQPNARRESLTKPIGDFLIRLVLGLVAGIILAYVFEYLDDTVQDEGDVQRWLGLPTLGVIPGGRQARPARSA